MTEFTALPQLGTLFTECDQIAKAIANMDKGGWLSLIMVSPPAATSPPTSEVVDFPMPVSIVIPAPTPPELMAAVRAAIVARNNAILAEFKTLGVTAMPAELT